MFLFWLPARMQGFNASMIAAVYPDLLVRTNATVAEMSVALAFGSAGGLLSPIFAVITDKYVHVISKLWYTTVQFHSNIHIKCYINFSIILLAGASCHIHKITFALLCFPSRICTLEQHNLKRFVHDYVGCQHRAV